MAKISSVRCVPCTSNTQCSITGARGCGSLQTGGEPRPSCAQFPRDRPAPGLSPFAETLYLQSRSPFHIPVSRIVEILESIERITTKLRSRADEHSAAHGTVGPATHGVLEIALGSSATPIASRAHRGLREWAYNRISMIRRVQMQVPMGPTPSELEKLNTLIREFKDLNRDLWNFL